MKKNAIIAVLVVLFLISGFLSWQAVQEKKDVFAYIHSAEEETAVLEEKIEEEKTLLRNEKTELEEWKRQNEGRREVYELWKRKSTEMEELLEN